MTPHLLPVAGGSISNMYAMNLARFQRYPDCKQRGLRALPPLALFTSEEVGSGHRPNPGFPRLIFSQLSQGLIAVLSSKEAKYVRGASTPWAHSGPANLPVFFHSVTTPSVRELLFWDLALTVSEWSRLMRGEGPSADMALSQLGISCHLLARVLWPQAFSPCAPLPPTLL